MFLSPRQRALALAIVALHLAVALYALWPTIGLGLEPAFGDHWIHYYRARVSAELFEATGRVWGYDPYLLAGTHHDASTTNSPLSNVFVALCGLLLGTPRAYGLWVILCTAVPPLSIVVAARLGGLQGRAVLVALVASLTFLHLDPVPGGMLRNGMVAWPAAAGLALWFAVAYARLLRAPSGRRFATCAIPLAFLGVHVLAPLLIALPYLASSAIFLLEPRGRARRLRWALGPPLFAIAVNLWWVLPLALGLGRAELEGWAFAPGLDWLLRDLASCLAPATGYYESSLGLRWSLVGLGGAALLLRVRGGGDGRERVTALALLGFATPALCLAYAGGHVELLGRIEPHRLLVPAVLALSLAAGWGLKLFSRLRRGPLGLIAACLLLASVAISLAWGGRGAWRLGARPHELTPPEAEVVAFLKREARAGDRVLAEQEANAALCYGIALEPELAGLSFRAAGQANLLTGWDPLTRSFLGRLEGSVSIEEVAARLERYAVDWVVTRSPAGRGLLAHLPSESIRSRHQVAGYDLVRLRPGPTLVGPGKLRILPGGRLELSELRGPVVVRMHYADGLWAEPAGARIERAEDPSDATGWIRVLPGESERVLIGR